jgi:hypothetical protein
MKLLATLIVLFLTASFSFGQNTYIPDSNFEAALIFEGLDNVLDDSVSTSSIDTVTILDLEPFSITDLTGIEDFLALEVLVCRNNNIQQLDLSSNVFLEFLNCENNFMTNLNISNNQLLERLFSENNNLTTIDLSQNPLLYVLDLNGNGLGTIDVTANPLLKILLLRNTTISAIDLSNNTLLEDIDVSVNNLSSLDLTGLSNLQTLLIHDNDINALNLTDNVNLEILLSMRNDLNDLDLTNNPLLTYIDCYDNDLHSLILPPIDTLSIDTYNLGSVNNANLFCIQCDHPTYVENNWNVVIDSFTVLSNTCTLSLNENSKVETLNIFPNPSTGEQITLNSSVDGTFELIDLKGSTLKNGNIIKGDNSVDVSLLTSGIYIIQVQSDNEYLTVRIEISN